MIAERYAFKGGSKYLRALQNEYISTHNSCVTIPNQTFQHTLMCVNIKTHTHEIQHTLMCVNIKTHTHEILKNTYINRRRRSCKEASLHNQTTHTLLTYNDNKQVVNNQRLSPIHDDQQSLVSTSSIYTPLGLEQIFVTLTQLTTFHTRGQIRIQQRNFASFVVYSSTGSNTVGRTMVL